MNCVSTKMSPHATVVVHSDYLRIQLGSSDSVGLASDWSDRSDCDPPVVHFGSSTLIDHISKSCRFFVTLNTTTLLYGTRRILPVLTNRHVCPQGEPTGSARCFMHRGVHRIWHIFERLELFAHLHSHSEDNIVKVGLNCYWYC